MNERLALRLHLGALAPLTVSELAIVLGVGEERVRDAVRGLRGLQVGRHTRYLFGEVVDAVRDGLGERPGLGAPRMRRAALRGR